MARRMAKGERPVAHDVGTMWTMTRNGCTARCALLTVADEWELRALVDGQAILAQRAPAVHELFALAERWCERLAARGWRKVVPQRAAPAAASACVPVPGTDDAASTLPPGAAPPSG